MEYNYKSRSELVKSYKASWNKKNALRMKTVSGENRTLVEEMIENRYDKTEKIQDKYTTLDSVSAFIQKNYKKCVNLLVPKEFQQDYYYILDKYNQFQFPKGYHRRSVRTADYASWIQDAFLLMKNYYNFGIFQCGIKEISRYLRDELPEELQDYKYHQFGLSKETSQFDNIIMARIDAGDEAVIQTIREMFISENNTAVVSTNVIRAVVKSSNRKLHELLGKFLLAARLSEGVRQAICENADCGTVGAFLEILRVIQEGNLVRFAAVKRAIATWTGVCNTEHLDRITGKVLDDIVIITADKAKAVEFIHSEDAVHIVLGLWGLGFYEIADAIREMEGILERGNRVQMLAMSYANLSFERPEFASKIANRVIERYAEDMEMVAAFMPSYMRTTEHYVFEVCKGIDKGKTLRVPFTHLFEDEAQARRHFEILKNIYETMGKKKMEFSPLVFPWYGVVLQKNDVLSRLSLLAYMFGEEEIVDYVCTRFEDFSADTLVRSRNVKLHLHAPKNQHQRNALLSYVASKETRTRECAAELVEKLTLTDAEYEILEGFLRYKKEDLRRNIIDILKKRDEEGLKTTIGRLLDSGDSRIRMAGLDLLQLRRGVESDTVFQALLPKVSEISAPASEEQILIAELVGGAADSIVKQEGFGLYHPSAQLPELPAKYAVAKPEVFCTDEEKIQQTTMQLLAFLESHAQDEYTDLRGQEHLLGDGGSFLGTGFSFNRITDDTSLPLHEQYPFEDLLQEFYESYVQSPSLLFAVYYAFFTEMDDNVTEKGKAVWKRHNKALYGISDIKLPQSKWLEGYWSHRTVGQILRCMMSKVGIKLPKEAARQAVLYVLLEMSEEELWYEYVFRQTGYYGAKYDKSPYTEVNRFQEYLKLLKCSENDGEFADDFLLLSHLDRKVAAWKHLDTDKDYFRNDNNNELNMLYYVKAFSMGIISEDIVYKVAFEWIGVVAAIKELGLFMKEKFLPYEEEQLENLAVGEMPDKESTFWQTGVQVYKKLIDVILDVELTRGDSPTVFSEAALSIKKIYGMERLIAILNAFGKSKLSRGVWHYGKEKVSKKNVLSHLLRVCEPMAGDDAAKLSAAVKTHKIKEERLIEVAMYAPQWLDIIEECMGYPGMKSGCYYFMAHMDENFDDKRKAMIAKYTPLSTEELQGGCFDVKWFYEAYEMLGEERFDKIYASAKYISSGSKHSRARKYADAALARVTPAELEDVIADKRNKDLLMSYGIIPVKDKKELLHRYEFLQKFLKESKQFGAQRRASEASAAGYALKNLATTAGYSDDLRLTLEMETELAKVYAKYFDFCSVGDALVKIAVDENGKVSLAVQKNGKTLKSVPAALKKTDEFKEIKAFYDKLRAQYSRTVAMFEKSMEDRETYQLGELVMLCENPVTKQIVENLVYVSEDGTVFGMLQDGALTEILPETAPGGRWKAPSEDAALRIAHPYDFYREHVWEAYQKIFFARNCDGGKKQPFKQVFRELYVKLPEEAQKEVSLMFAGNQIQPNKTVACLRGRRWVADYESGLQKVYYADDIIAGIYAIADWFSPADVEEPVLEWVTFTNRKTLQPVKIKDVPDILYSEVMRDVDLAVSVAHAGGVDPETSHSTVEMRKVILTFNLELFGISNVTMEKNHAIVEGKRGRYSIHLGSGVVHRIGGHQINIVAVQGSKRSKIFLPFIDEDPKTAEIMTKVLMFAQDDKIKDPYIMEQIMR